MSTEMRKSLNEALDNIQLKLIRTEDETMKARLKALEKTIANELHTAYAPMDDYILQDMTNVSETAFNSSMKSLETHGAAAVSFVSLPKRAMKEILDMDQVVKFGDKGYKISDFTELQSASQVKRFKQIVAAGLADGSSVQTISRRLKEVHSKVVKNDIDAIARTVVAEARSRAQSKAYEAADDVIIGWESIGVLDSRTTKQCAALDGRVWRKSQGYTEDKLRKLGYWYPRHFRCRTVVVPRTEFSAALDKGSTRASQDGPMSAKTDFQEFFDKQSEEFKRDYLGDARYELYKSNKLEIKDFVDVKSGREYTIGEINKRMGTETIKPSHSKSKTTKKSKVPIIDLGYNGKFNKHVDNMTDDAKIVVDKLEKPKEIVVGKGVYYPRQKRVSSPLSETRTFRHEYGHFIDNVLSEKDTGFYSKVRLAEASKKDGEILGIHIEGFDRGGELVRKRTEVLKDFKEKWYLKKDLYYTRGKKKGKLKGYTYKPKEGYQEGASDIIDSMADGWFRDNHMAYGHGGKYYFRNIENKMTENFANLFELWSDNKDWDKVKELFPNLTKEFEAIMKEVANGKFD